MFCVILSRNHVSCFMSRNCRFNSIRAGLGGEGGRLQEQDQPAADGAQENQLHLPLPRPAARRINNDSHRRLMPELLVASPIENWLSFWGRGGGGVPPARLVRPLVNLL